MVKNHLKRHATPKFWNINRKIMSYIVRPKPGAHRAELSMPLAVVLRDTLKLCSTLKEVKFLLNNTKVLVNGKRRYSLKYVVGLLDILSLEDGKLNYLAFMDKKGKLILLSITSKEATSRLSKIVNKTYLPKGVLQLNLRCGANIRADTGSKKETEYKTGDTVKIDMNEKKILDHYVLEKGACVLLHRGRHKGLIGVVESIEGNNLFFKTGEGELMETKRAYCIVLGKGKPVVKTG